MTPSSPSPEADIDIRTARPIAYTAQRLAELIQDTAGNGISERTIRQWCARNQIPGAAKVGGRWLIPASAVDRLLTGPLPDNVTLFRK